LSGDRKYVPDSNEQRRDNRAHDKSTKTEDCDPTERRNQYKVTGHLRVFAYEKWLQQVVHKAHDEGAKDLLRHLPPVNRWTIH
jgi:hypothetical protein